MKFLKTSLFSSFKTSGYTEQLLLDWSRNPDNFGFFPAINHSLVVSVLTAAIPLFQQSRGKRAKVKYNRGKSQRSNNVWKPESRIKQDGTFVYKGEVLVKQYGLTYYPGENVGIQKNNTLYALRDGIVVVSCEKLNPFPDSPLYERVKNGLEICKKFWNIYPTPVHPKFKLISESWFL